MKQADQSPALPGKPVAGMLDPMFPYRDRQPLTADQLEVGLPISLWVGLTATDDGVVTVPVTASPTDNRIWIPGVVLQRDWVLMVVTPFGVWPWSDNNLVRFRRPLPGWDREGSAREAAHVIEAAWAGRDWAWVPGLMRPAMRFVGLPESLDPKDFIRKSYNEGDRPYDRLFSLLPAERSEAGELGP